MRAPLPLLLLASAAVAQTPPPPPPDWAAAVRAGDMLFWSGALPPPGHFPSLGNGYLAKAVGPYHSVGQMNDFGSFYLAGVFNGVGNVTPSHRAAIPTPPTCGCGWASRWAPRWTCVAAPF